MLKLPVCFVPKGGGKKNWKHLGGFLGAHKIERKPGAQSPGPFEPKPCDWEFELGKNPPWIGPGGIGPPCDEKEVTKNRQKG